MYSASAFAANAAVRAVVAAAFPLFTVQMFTNVGDAHFLPLITDLPVLFSSMSTGRVPSLASSPFSSPHPHSYSTSTALGYELIASSRPVS
jgi:hypothetical protein